MEKMIDYGVLKAKLHAHLIEMVDQKIQTAESAIAAAKHSRDNETKSTAGDKYETGRAMMHIEIEKNQNQLEKAITLDTILQSIKDNESSDVIKLGSLVVTNKGIYFLSIGLGKVQLDNEVYFVISVASPIGQLLVGKSKGDAVLRNGKEIEVREVV